MAKATSKATAATTTRGATTTASKNTTTAPVKTAKLPVTSFACGRLGILSLLTKPYTQAGSTLVGLDQLEAYEQEMFTKFLEYAGEPLQPLDLTKIVRVSVNENKETGVFALKSISGFAVCRDGDQVVLSLGSNSWEVEQETTETGSIFRVGKLSSTLNCNSPKDGEALTAWFNWRIRDTAAGQVYEWADAPAWLRREEDGDPVTAKDLRSIMTDGEPLLASLGFKIVNPEPIWKLCYPNGDDSQEPLDLPLEYDMSGVSIKTYPNGTGGPSRVAHLIKAPIDAIAVRLNAANTVDQLVAAKRTTFPIGTYKLQIFSIEVKEEGDAVKHYVGHQIQQGKAITIELEEDYNDDEIENIEATNEEEAGAAYEETEETEFESGSEEGKETKGSEEDYEEESEEGTTENSEEDDQY